MKVPRRHGEAVTFVAREEPQNPLRGRRRRFVSCTRGLLGLRALRVPLALLLVAAVLRLLEPEAIQPWVWGPLLALCASAWLWDARSHDARARTARQEGEETDRAVS